MADRVLFIGWGTTVRGREQRALEVFNEALGMYGRMQQEARIESFDVTLLGASSVLNGFMTVKGDTAQIQAVQEDEEFKRAIADASLIVEDLNVIAGHTNAGVAGQMAIFADAIAKVPQTA
jgi:hypothetical protein